MKKTTPRRGMAKKTPHPCPTCAKSMRRDVRETEYTYKNEFIAVVEQPAWWCRCGMFVLEDGADTRVAEKAQRAAKKQYAAWKRAAPAQLRRVRRKVGLTCAAMQGILRVSGSWANYERGLAVPPLALELLTGLLDDNPSLIDTMIRIHRERKIWNKELHEALEKSPRFKKTRAKS